MKLLKFISPHRGHLYEGNIVLHNYKAIYLPIPKVACTSIKKELCDILDIPAIDPDNPNTGIHSRNYPYVSKNDIHSKYNDYYVFCFVRNPYDRLVSCYSNKISKDPSLTNTWFKKGVARIFRRYGNRMWGGMSFEDFVKAVAEISDQQADIHFRPQWLTLYDKKGNKLPHFIGKFETLSRDFNHVISETGLPIVQLPHLMKSSNQRYKDFYTEKIKEIVDQRYEKDLTLFEYHF